MGTRTSKNLAKMTDKYDLMLVENALSRLTLAARPADVLLRPRVGHIQTLDFHGGRAAADAGEAAVREALPALKEAIAR